ncbi:hypothetical protein MUK42_32866 [Musa troglodytarum]|uniref:Uncharacterized protein n=1 Tax=Musa troglodytarum TaxID=320322 RepID=A0A9E7HRG0_9LILI|nr:hypothetical protein MUK42_32866 [Musa troglodytarum]
MAPRRNRARLDEARKHLCPCSSAVQSPHGGPPAATSEPPGQSDTPRPSSTPPTQEAPSSQETFSVLVRLGKQSFEFAHIADSDQLEKMKLDCSEEAMEQIIYLSKALEVLFHDYSFDMKHLAWKFKRELGVRGKEQSIRVAV